VACLAGWLGSGGAWAAEVHLRGPAACVDATAVAEKAEQLLDRTLSSVEGVDFAVEIAKRPDHRWRLRVETIDRLHRRKRSRALHGETCAAVAAAAAVAIAMSVTARDAEAGLAEPLPAAEPLVAATPERPGAELVARPPTAAPLRPSLALGMVADDGALPRAALGLQLEAAMQRRWWRLAALAALFAPQETRVSPSAGGDFQLALAGVLGCFTRARDRLTLLGCGGGEVGRLAGTGTGVTNPRLGSALWAAGRAELGASLSLGARLTVLVRAGAAVPVQRRLFVVDGTTPVHRSSATTARTMLALELAL
jgi:hypothetical protein